MPRQQWPLSTGRPVIEIALAVTLGKQTVTRTLLADTGAGSDKAGFELLLDEQDCLLCDGSPCQAVSLGGAYSGVYPVYLLRVQLPQLGFERYVRAVGVPHSPAGLHGIACFRFLNQFGFGNFGDAKHFGLEV